MGKSCRKWQHRLEYPHIGTTGSHEARQSGRTSAVDYTRITGPTRAVASALGQDRVVATMFLMVGLPAAGKTTRANELAARHRALLLSPDEWMIPLFGEPEADGRRDVLEGRLITLGLQAVRPGTNVVLDFGCWARDERSAIRWLARSVGASCEIVYVAVDRATQLERLALRPLTAADVRVSQAQADQAREFFQVPDAAELADLLKPPPGRLDWPAWAANRWPSLDYG